MTREAFLERLEYLLKDISEQERKDALDYYNAYMDDAGLLAADEVEGFLESPEVIAASIRNSLNGKQGTPNRTLTTLSYLRIISA